MDQHSEKRSGKGNERKSSKKKYSAQNEELNQNQQGEQLKNRENGSEKMKSVRSISERRSQAYSVRQWETQCVNGNFQIKKPEISMSKKKQQIQLGNMAQQADKNGKDLSVRQWSARYGENGYSLKKPQTDYIMHEWQAEYIEGKYYLSDPQAMAKLRALQAQIEAERLKLLEIEQNQKFQNSFLSHQPLNQDDPTKQHEILTEMNESRFIKRKKNAEDDLLNEESKYKAKIDQMNKMRMQLRKQIGVGTDDRESFKERNEISMKKKEKNMNESIKEHSKEDKQVSEKPLTKKSVVPSERKSSRSKVEDRKSEKPSERNQQESERKTKQKSIRDPSAKDPSVKQPSNKQPSVKDKEEHEDHKSVSPSKKSSLVRSKKYEGEDNNKSQHLSPEKKENISQKKSRRSSHHSKSKKQEIIDLPAPPSHKSKAQNLQPEISQKESSKISENVQIRVNYVQSDHGETRSAANHQFNPSSKEEKHEDYKSERPSQKRDHSKKSEHKSHRSRSKRSEIIHHIDQSKILSEAEEKSRKDEKASQMKSNAKQKSVSQVSKHQPSERRSAKQASVKQSEHSQQASVSSHSESKTSQKHSQSQYQHQQQSSYSQTNQDQSRDQYNESQSQSQSYTQQSQSQSYVEQSGTNLDQTQSHFQDKTQTEKNIGFIKKKEPNVLPDDHFIKIDKSIQWEELSQAKNLQILAQKERQDKKSQRKSHLSHKNSERSKVNKERQEVRQDKSHRSKHSQHQTQKHSQRHSEKHSQHRSHKSTKKSHKNHEERHENIRAAEQDSHSKYMQNSRSEMSVRNNDKQKIDPSQGEIQDNKSKSFIIHHSRQKSVKSKKSHHHNQSHHSSSRKQSDSFTNEKNVNRKEIDKLHDEIKTLQEKLKKVEEKQETIIRFENNQSNIMNQIQLSQGSASEAVSPLRKGNLSSKLKLQNKLSLAGSTVEFNAMQELHKNTAEQAQKLQKLRLQEEIGRLKKIIRDMQMQKIKSIQHDPYLTQSHARSKFEQRKPINFFENQSRVQDRQRQSLNSDFLETKKNLWTSQIKKGEEFGKIIKNNSPLKSSLVMITPRKFNQINAEKNKNTADQFEQVDYGEDFEQEPLPLRKKAASTFSGRKNRIHHPREEYFEKFEKNQKNFHNFLESSNIMQEPESQLMDFTAPEKMISSPVRVQHRSIPPQEYKQSQQFRQPQKQKQSITSDIRTSQKRKYSQLIQNMRKQNPEDEEIHPKQIEIGDIQVPDLPEGPNVQMNQNELADLAKHTYSIFGIRVDDSDPNYQINMKKYKNCILFSLSGNSSESILWHYSGKFYMGGWKNNDASEGEKTGEGLQYIPGKHIYKGQFLGGKRNGNGILKTNSGNIYEGQWVDGVKSGRGTYFQANTKTIYSGEWKDGKRDGYGILKFSEVEFYEGTFQKSVKHGYGIERFGNGDIYKGEYQKGRFHGKGKYIWANGSSYEGDFVDGSRHGQGSWKSSRKQGDLYAGSYENDKKCGYGRYVWANGCIYEGRFENDLKNGKGKLIYQDGRQIKGNWQNGNLLNADTETRKVPNHQQEPLKRSIRVSSLRESPNLHQKQRGSYL